VIGPSAHAEDEWEDPILLLLFLFLPFESFFQALSKAFRDPNTLLQSLSHDLAGLLCDFLRLASLLFLFGHIDRDLNRPLCIKSLRIDMQREAVQSEVSSGVMFPTFGFSHPIQVGGLTTCGSGRIPVGEDRQSRTKTSDGHLLVLLADVKRGGTSTRSRRNDNKGIETTGHDPGRTPMLCDQWTEESSATL